jgi:hypothetical protein
MATETTQQEIPMQVEPQEQHRWLQKLVGEWDVEFEAVMAPGQAPEKSTGTESVRSIGDIWVVGEGHGSMPDGTPATTMLTLGYDPQTQRFVGTWIGSMMPYLWVYDGELDSAERKLSLDSDGPSMKGDGSLAKYRETIEFKSDDHRVFTSRTLGDDGTWQHFMTAQYRRRR